MLKNMLWFASSVLPLTLPYQYLHYIMHAKQNVEVKARVGGKFSNVRRFFRIGISLIDRRLMLQLQFLGSLLLVVQPSAFSLEMVTA